MRFFNWDVQNLNERPGDTHGHASGSILKHGRAWLRILDTALVAGFEWSLWSSWLSTGASVRCSNEDGLTFGIGLGPTHLYASLHVGVAANWFNQNDSRLARVAFHDGTLWVELWADENSHTMQGPFWHPERRRLSVNVVDAFLGAAKYTAWDLEERPVTVPMPERSYAGRAVVKTQEWRRSRWLFATRRQLVQIDMDEGEQIPVPGKGDNSWDCGEDATYSYSTGARSVEEAIGKLVGLVLHDRARRAGPDWLPERHIAVEPSG